MQIVLKEVTWNKDDKDKKVEDDKPYLHSISSNVQQQHNSKQSTISDFMT